MEYDELQVLAVLDAVGIEVDSETATHYLAFCFVHGNSDTPALAVDKLSGVCHCFNPGCNYSVSLVDLVKRKQDLDHFAALRLIHKAKTAQTSRITERIDALLNPPDAVVFPQATIDRMRDAFWAYQEPQDYMFGRGFKREALEYYNVGWSNKRQLVVVPMYDSAGTPVGVVGRSIVGKEFKNSPGLPRRSVLFNLNNAKRQGSDSVSITESTFDDLALYGARIMSNAAVLGDSFSKYHAQAIARTHKIVYNWVDSDKAGRILGNKIANDMQELNCRVMWPVYSPTQIFPDVWKKNKETDEYEWVMAKDAGELIEFKNRLGVSGEQLIQECHRNALTNYEYQLAFPLN